MGLKAKKKYKTSGCETRATRIRNEMVSGALKLTINAYIEKIIQVFPCSFVTTDFFAVINKKNYV